MSEDWGTMIEAGEVRHDGYMCEPCSDILRYTQSPLER